MTEAFQKTEETLKVSPTCIRKGGYVAWLLVVFLLVSNIATVVSEAVHNGAFQVVASIASISGKTLEESVLARSPTKQKARAVESATRQLQAQHTVLQARNGKLHTENEAVKASRAALAKEHDALRSIAAKRASAVKAAATRVSAVLASRAAEAVASLPVRAAPYVGIAALVGFTTVELKADCELARTLSELNAEHGNDLIDTGPVCRTIEKVPSPKQAWINVKAQASTGLRATYEILEQGAKRTGFAIPNQATR